jgi:hypothetical protein
VTKSGIGILVDAPGNTQNRIVACYLDYSSLVAVDPQELLIVDSFFLCAGNIVIDSGKECGLVVHNYRHIVLYYSCVYHAGDLNTIAGLTIMNNQFNHCTNDTVIFAGNFTSVQDITIVNNMVASNYTSKSTQASAKLTLTDATQFVFDFSDVLLLPYIVDVWYSIEIESGFAQHCSRPANGLTVMVETNVPVTGTVRITVDQNTPSHPVGNRRPLTQV